MSASARRATTRYHATVRRHLARGFQRAVFARPGGGDEQVLDGAGVALDEEALVRVLAAADLAAERGLVKHTFVIDERTRVVIDHRHGAAKLKHLDDEAAKKAMGGKDRALRPDTSAGLLRAIGIMNQDGSISASAAKKYKQVNHLIELCRPAWEAALAARRVDADAPLRVLDLACGNGVLTFVLAEALRLAEVPVRVHGIDAREDVITRCRERAAQLGWSHLTFERATIAGAKDGEATLGGRADLMLALHACDTATDEALAFAVRGAVPVIMAAPCCQHELAAQLAHADASAPTPAMRQHGLLRQEYAATLTDALRVELLDASGYAVDVLEFVDAGHTPKNLLLRAHARHGRLRANAGAFAAIERRCAELGVRPRLLEELRGIAGE